MEKGFETLGALLRDCGFSTQRAARAAGVDKRTVERWLAGGMAYPENAAALAEALGFPHPCCGA